MLKPHYAVWTWCCSFYYNYTKLQRLADYCNRKRACIKKALSITSGKNSNNIKNSCSFWRIIMYRLIIWYTLIRELQSGSEKYLSSQSLRNIFKNCHLSGFGKTRWISSESRFWKIDYSCGSVYSDAFCFSPTSLHGLQCLCSFLDSVPKYVHVVLLARKMVLLQLQTLVWIFPKSRNIFLQRRSPYTQTCKQNMNQPKSRSKAQLRYTHWKKNTFRWDSMQLLFINSKHYLNRHVSVHGIGNMQLSTLFMSKAGLCAHYFTVTYLNFSTNHEQLLHYVCVIRYAAYTYKNSFFSKTRSHID